MADADRQVEALRMRGLETFSDAEEAARMADDLVSGAITSLKRPITIPSTKGVDLTKAREDTRRVRESREDATDVIDLETGRLLDAAELQKEAIKREGGAAADKVMADQSRAQQEADVQKYFAELFGISMNPDADIALTAQRLRELKPGAEEKLRRIQEMQSVGLLDNPLAWIANQIQMPAAIGDYNAEAQVINSLQATIDNAIQSGQNAATFATKGLPTITVAQAQAEAARLKALADKNQAVTDENLAKTNVTFAVQKLANDLNVANQTRNMSAIDLQNEQTKYQSLVNEINLADTHANRLLKAAQLLEKLEGSKGLDVLLENYDRVMGHPKGTTTRYVFEKFAENQRQNIVAIGAGSLGADPFEGMINWYKSRPGPGASPETRRFFEYLRDSSEKIAVDQKVQMLDEKQKPAAISARLKEQIRLDLNDASKVGGVFYEMSPTAMIASKELPADSRMAEMLKPFTNQSGPVPTQMILEVFNKEFKNPVEAGQAISEYYSRNIKLRNSVMNTSVAGVSLPKEYKIKQVPFGSLPFTEARRMQFDLTKPEQATKLVLVMRQNELARHALPLGVGSFGAQR